jgi:tetratricopeptide (TPR) repeat protein
MGSEARLALESARRRIDRGDIANAAAAYERALGLGLDGEERRIALTGLGAALLQLGRNDEAQRVLAVAVGEWPERSALRALHAVALHAVGEGREAVATLVDVVLREIAHGDEADALRDCRDRLRRGAEPTAGFVELARTMTQKEFARAFDFPFLLAVGPALAINDDEDTHVGQKLEAVDERYEARTAASVLPVRATRGLVPSAITVGRAPTNDVVIPDGRVSKLHAVFRRHGRGWELADAGSRNGTFAGEQRLQSQGPAVPVSSGDILAFGHAAFFFLSASALWDRLRKRG